MKTPASQVLLIICGLSLKSSKRLHCIQISCGRIIDKFWQWAVKRLSIKLTSTPHNLLTLSHWGTKLIPLSTNIAYTQKIWIISTFSRKIFQILIWFLVYIFGKTIIKQQLQSKKLNCLRTYYPAQYQIWKKVIQDYFGLYSRWIRLQQFTRLMFLGLWPQNVIYFLNLVIKPFAGVIHINDGNLFDSVAVSNMPTNSFEVLRLDNGQNLQNFYLPTMQKFK